jgi:hypothetical protein
VSAAVFFHTKERTMNAIAHRKYKRIVGVFLAGIAGLIATAAQADGEMRALDFETHAAFFSAETHQKATLDPQVFVAERGAPAVVGPQNIKHVADLRNALLSDSPTLPIVNASGQALNMTLGAWLGAKGQVILTRLPDGREQVSVAMSSLKPNGHYSLFENHFDQKPIGFTPLDGNGTDNNFVADAQGKAVITTISPAPLTHDNAVLLVYHSDGKSHGKLRGEIGVTAHHQLIVRP